MTCENCGRPKAIEQQGFAENSPECGRFFGYVADCDRVTAARYKAEAERLMRERDEARATAKEATRVCDQPGCLSAVLRRDDGSRVCSAGHASQWVDAADLALAIAERDEARSEIERLRDPPVGTFECPKCGKDTPHFHPTVYMPERPAPGTPEFAADMATASHVAPAPADDDDAGVGRALTEHGRRNSLAGMENDALRARLAACEAALRGAKARLLEHYTERGAVLTAIDAALSAPAEPDCCPENTERCCTIGGDAAARCTLADAKDAAERRCAALEAVVRESRPLTAAHADALANGTAALDALVREAEQRGAERALSEWSDAPDEWTPAVAEAHPTRSGSHAQFATAMRMVGSRRSKAALVALVNWLLLERQKPDDIDPTDARVSKEWLRQYREGAERDGAEKMRERAVAFVEILVGADNPDVPAVVRATVRKVLAVKADGLRALPLPGDAAESPYRRKP